MATTNAQTTGPVSGLPLNEGARYHFDIYAILEAPQELYFGSEVAVNVNMVETVEVMLPNGSVIEKCYIAPSKRRGVERRTLIWAPLANGTLLGDALGCGIPGTCFRPDCPMCSVYGGLVTSKTKVTYVQGGSLYEEELEPTTYLGRLTHGGGVAVQAQEVSTKQRAMHPSKMLKQGEDNPTPFRRQYNQPALLYPVYNHCLSITDAQFNAIAYAFLNVLPRIGAGNPKGVRVANGDLLGTAQSLLVVDRYRVPLGARPVVSPAITNQTEAIDSFAAQAVQVRGAQRQSPVTGVDQKGDVIEEHRESSVFTRWIGAAAMKELEERALSFTTNVLLAGTNPRERS